MEFEGPQHVDFQAPNRESIVKAESFLSEAEKLLREHELKKDLEKQSYILRVLAATDLSA